MWVWIALVLAALLMVGVMVNKAQEDKQRKAAYSAMIKMGEK